MDTTRRFPRSMAEAWPRDHAAAVEIHRSVEPMGWRVVRWTLLAAAVFLVLMHFAGWLP